MPFFSYIIIGTLLMDIYLIISMRQLFSKRSPLRKWMVHGVWISSLAVLLLFGSYRWLFDSSASLLREMLFTYTMCLFFGKLFAVVFFLLDDFRRLAWRVFRKKEAVKNGEDGSVALSRSAFLSWMGIGIGTVFTGTMFAGMRNVYNYRVKKVSLKNDKIPAAFKGFKIVQISDIHSGSFNSVEGPAKGVEMILDLKPDLILFTGDLVNSSSREMEPYTELFRQLKAPYGVYSVLGNHDYAKYMPGTKAEKAADVENMIKLQEQMGWKLLRNEQVVLEKDGQEIHLIGVENWSTNTSFPTYGDLEKAYQGVDTTKYQILMSHDPTHWEAEIVKKFPEIDLTLSGHTHGMQFGFEIPGLKWSPVQWVYKQWMGMYQHKQQQLYVNTGYGFIGYPGRVGILPEITLFELG